MAPTLLRRAVFGVRWSDVTDIAWWTVSDLTSTVIGTVVVLAIAARSGSRLTAHIAGPATAPPVKVRPRVFWTTAASVTATGCTAMVYLPAAPLAAIGVRLLHLAALALLAGSVAVRISARA